MKSPLLNALAASTYIGILVFGMSHVAEIGHNKPDTMMIPMFMLSLFVLSAALMGFLFFSRPLELYIEHKKKEALTFFWKTVGVFALITSIFALLMLYTIVR
jgi:hypothetical protein